MDASMTQEALAERLAVSRQTISNWENGRSFPDIASIIALSDVYSITLDSLLKGDEAIIKHLKESTDTVKSNKRVVTSLMILGFVLLLFCVAGLISRLVPRGLMIGAMIPITGFFVYHLCKQAPFGKAKEARAEQEANEQI
jgi:transcriptional regulator with XRE-family HTH domain